MLGDLLRAALAYAERNFRLIPLNYMKERDGQLGCSCYKAHECRAAGKHPIFRGWQTVATNDTYLVRRWWEAWPLANIGLVMGGPERLVTIDIDGNEGRESLETLQREHGALPPTLIQVTGRDTGGEHRLYRVPESLNLYAIRNRCRLAAGIDVRSEGGLIVAAPSIHPSGRSYRWVNKLPIGDLPEWLYQIAMTVRPEKRNAMTEQRPNVEGLPSIEKRLYFATRYLAKMPPAIQGQNGSNACLKAAIALIRGFCLTPDEAFQILWEDYNPRCVPPWSEDELWHKIESAEHLVSVPWKYLLPKHGGGVSKVADALHAEATVSVESLWSVTPTVQPEPVEDSIEDIWDVQP